jgi:hypothetical protein
MTLNVLQQKIKTVLNKYPVSKAALFGSFARGEENGDSDIDILIQTSQPISLFDILKIERELFKVTKRKIDILEYSAIKPTIKQNVLRESLPIL